MTPPIKFYFVCRDNFSNVCECERYIFLHIQFQSVSKGRSLLSAKFSSSISQSIRLANSNDRFEKKTVLIYFENKYNCVNLVSNYDQVI